MSNAEGFVSDSDIITCREKCMFDSIDALIQHYTVNNLPYKSPYNIQLKVPSSSAPPPPPHPSSAQQRPVAKAPSLKLTHCKWLIDKIYDKDMPCGENNFIVSLPSILGDEYKITKNTEEYKIKREYSIRVFDTEINIYVTGIFSISKKFTKKYLLLQSKIPLDSFDQVDSVFNNSNITFNELDLLIEHYIANPISVNGKVIYLQTENKFGTKV